MKLVPADPAVSSGSMEPFIIYQPCTPSSKDVASTSKKHPLERPGHSFTTISKYDILTPPNINQLAATDTPTVPDPDQSVNQVSLQPHSSYQSMLMTAAPPFSVAPNERIVLPTNKADQNLPFTKENYGKEKDKWILKKHICQYCGKRCLKPSDLTRHVKIHTGEYSYECTVCNRKFREKFNLNAHLRKGNCY